MMINLGMVSNTSLLAIAEEISRGMSHALETQAGVFISTPISYPSGASVVIMIEKSGDSFFVTDGGFGYQEAMMISASHSFVTVAQSLIKNTGVSFDRRSFFVAKATQEDLVPIVGAVANFSQRAVIETIFKHDAKKADRDKEILVSRLEYAFGVAKVSKDYEIRGASSVEWDVAAKVDAGNIVSIFDFAKPHKNSVVNAVAKFHDIARLENAPRRFISVANKNSMGEMLGLLSQAASVISLADTPDDVLRAIAA
jgi:hypothetical protein